MQLQTTGGSAPAHSPRSDIAPESLKQKIGSLRYDRADLAVGYVYSAAGESRVHTLGGTDTNGSYVAPSRAISRMPGQAMPKVADPLAAPSKSEIIAKLGLEDNGDGTFSRSGVSGRYTAREHWAIHWLDLKEASGTRGEKVFTRNGFSGHYTLQTEGDTTVSVFYTGGTAAIRTGSKTQTVVMAKQTYHHGVWDMTRVTAIDESGTNGGSTSPSGGQPPTPDAGQAPAPSGSQPATTPRTPAGPKETPPPLTLEPLGPRRVQKPQTPVTSPSTPSTPSTPPPAQGPVTAPKPVERKPQRIPDGPPPLEMTPLSSLIKQQGSMAAVDDLQVAEQARFDEYVRWMKKQQQA